MSRAMILGVICALCGVLLDSVRAATVTAELQKIARGATFEVVLRKPESERLTYDKPLPLDLLPFAERNDKYLSIGTAFALSDGTFVSAAHVMILGIGSPLGAPLLRDAAGNVYAVSKVLKFSSREDYMAFTLAVPPAAAQPLVPATDTSVDDQVFAVGNAFGAGVVIRDGLFTSETPEDQDGSWNWLRFSAAASPGNSGGPLLDASGHIVGMVAAKSPNENLNYALPIRRITQGSAKAATFNQRGAFGLPMLKDRITVTMNAVIPLPKTFGEFVDAYRSVMAANQRKSSDQLLTSAAGSLWPKGKSQKLLADLAPTYFPKIIQQNADAEWQAIGVSSQSTDLGGDGFVEVGDSDTSILLFRIRRANQATDTAFYSDTEQAGNLLLKGLTLQRFFGSEAIRITSLGVATVDTPYKDKFGRQWQLRSWPLGYDDQWVNALMLPTPDGYVGIYGSSSGLYNENGVALLLVAADYISTSYSGSLPQWQSFLTQRRLRPAGFDEIKLNYDVKYGLNLTTPRFSVALPIAGTLIGERTVLDLQMSYILEGERLVWDASGMGLEQAWDKQSHLYFTRVSRPGDDSGKAAQQRWREILNRSNSYANTAWPDSDLSKYWIATVLDASARTAGSFPASSRVLYTLTCAVDREILPRELYEMQQMALRGIRVLEK
jgi:serine protease Do